MDLKDYSPFLAQLPLNPLPFTLNDGTTILYTSTILLGIAFVFVLFGFDTIKTALIFAYNCFLKPLGRTDSQSERLDRFYEKQADVYDKTRDNLLQGRRTMLKLCAAQMRLIRKSHPNKKLVWVDIGGGTGWNIEQMDEYFDLSHFDKIYLIDLCEPLLQVARDRFSGKGYTNVQVLCQNAKNFTLPGLQDNQMVDLFTCSYSISMIPPFYAVLDRIDEFLDPQTGFFGVVDFYVSSRTSIMSDQKPLIGGDTSRQCSWLSSWFWRLWFSFDHIELHPARRDYLEYKFGTIKCFNGRNNFLIPYIVQIPFYIWLGVSRSRDTKKAIQAFEVESGNCVVVPPSFPELSRERLLDFDTDSEPESPELAPRRFSDDASSTASSRRLSLGRQYPLSSFHYQRRQWRLPFVDSQFSDMVRTWIYGFTWEDPYVDMEHLNLSSNDSILCITSAGDNALHYAIAANPKRIHAVDMNPCQGHLLELKLACIMTLDYEAFWKMFGEGKIENFKELLDTKISPYLTSHAYQFWRLNTDSFKEAFYLQGYSGKALKLVQRAIGFFGARKYVEMLCHANSIEEQQSIWSKYVRRVLINKPLTKLVMANPSFLWNALGVPMNQYDIFKNEGVTAEQFAIDTLDPIPSHSLLKTENYHYYLTLMSKYTKECCPLYLKEDAFNSLKNDDCKRLDSFRLHTDSIVNVLRGLEDQSLTRAILMDHMDWFDPVSDDVPAPSLKDARRDSDTSISDLDREIVELSRVIKRQGAVFWRSAAKYPWYNSRFEKMGFSVEPVHIRHSGTSIDSVNMYASFYKAVRL